MKSPKFTGFTGRPFAPELVGVGSSLGLLAGFAVLFLMMRANRQKWLAQG